MTNSSPHAVIFDIGGVLLDWDPAYLYRNLFSDREEMEKFLQDVCSPDWNAELDRGYPFAKAVEELAGLYPHYREAIMAYDSRWMEMISGPVQGTVTILEKLVAAGWPVYGLTNFSAEKFRESCRAFPFLKRFQGVVVSGEEGVLKPEPAIYRLLESRFDLDLSRALFIDDKPENVTGARETGLSALVFTTPTNLEADLSAAGVLP